MAQYEAQQLNKLGLLALSFAVIEVIQRERVG